MGPAVLVADDEAGIRDLLRWELGAKGYQVVAAASGSDAIDLLRREEFALVISDVRMPGMDGFDVLRASKRLAPNTEVVIATAYADFDYAVKCVRGGAFDLVNKPFDIEALLATMSRALEVRERRIGTALAQAGRAIFATDDLFALPETIVSVAKEIMGADDASVMLTGDDGKLFVLRSDRLSAEDQATIRASMDCVAGRVATSRKPAILPDAFSDDPRLADLRDTGMTRSSIVHPLLLGDRCLGVLNLNRTVNETPYRPADLERVTVLASQIALALENVRLGRQAALSERLAAVGLLATSVAHEINNPLCCLVGATDALRGLITRVDLGADQAEVTEILDDAELAVSRIREIARDLKNFSRGGDRARTLVDLNEVVRASLRLSAAEVRTKATVRTRFGEGVTVSADLGRLSQVFVNLLVNAAQAMVGPGRQNEIAVTIERDGDRVVARVRDDGQGIAAHNLHRVFEPFFTTKAPGMGTGLGLSISRDIIREYGGELSVESTLGEGATFTVELPAAATLKE